MRRPAKGFTLTETVVVIALTTLLMCAIASMVRYLWVASAQGAAQNAGIASARIELARMADQIRMASSTVSATGDAYTFIDLSGTATTLAAPDTTFIYTDASGTPLTDPVDPAQVRTVLITMTRLDPPLTLSTAASLRNRYHP